MCDLASADSPKTRREVAVVEGLESAAGVVRGVPRHVSERGEGQGRYADGHRTVGDVLEQLAPDPAPCAAGMYRDLLDVKVAVDDVGDEVADRRVGGVGGDPGTACLVVTGEYVQRQRFILAI